MDLQANYLLCLRTQTLVGLFSLKALNLEGNKIKSIDHGSFLSLATAISINLTNNNLAIIGKNMFTGLHSITETNLRNNCIFSIEARSLEHLSTAQTMDWSENILTIIYRFTLKGLYNIHEITFRSNNIHTIEAGSFEHLVSAKTIDLSNNKLTIICKGMLDGLPTINEISFSSNRINTIEPGAFAGVGSNVTSSGSKVRFVMTYNRLSALRWNIFLNNPEKTEDLLRLLPSQSYSLALYHNPQLQCDDVNHCWLKELKIKAGPVIAHHKDKCWPKLNQICPNQNIQHNLNKHPSLPMMCTDNRTLCNVTCRDKDYFVGELHFDFGMCIWQHTCYCSCEYY